MIAPLISTDERIARIRGFFRLADARWFCADSAALAIRESFLRLLRPWDYDSRMYGLEEWS